MVMSAKRRCTENQWEGRIRASRRIRVRGVIACLLTSWNDLTPWRLLLVALILDYSRPSYLKYCASCNPSILLSTKDSLPQFGLHCCGRHGCVSVAASLAYLYVCLTYSKLRKQETAYFFKFRPFPVKVRWTWSNTSVATKLEFCIYLPYYFLVRILHARGIEV